LNQQQVHALLLRGAAAIFGLAVAIALLPHFAASPPPPTQLPSLATAHGFDGRAPFRFVVCVIVLTLGAPLVFRTVIARLVADDARAWARTTAIASMAAALWFASIQKDVLWTIAIGAIPTAAVLLLRRFRASFGRGDAVLVPLFATVFMAVVDAAPRLDLAKVAVVSVSVVLALRLVIAGIRGETLPYQAFVLAPLALVMQAHVHALHIRHLAWPPLTITIVTPLLLRVVLRASWRRQIRWLLAFVVYPLVTLAYASATSALAAEGKPHGDLFEDSHRFVPASEMLRGERPYVDIVPVHGFVEDGFLDYLSMRTGEVTEGRLVKTHGVISALNSVASYAIAAAATQSAEMGIVSYFLAVVFGLAGGTFRAFPALASVVLDVAALRTGRPALFVFAGGAVVLAALTSVDFGAYAFVALAVAIALSRDMRSHAAKGAAFGILAAGVPVLLAFGVFGFLGAFFHTTLFEALPSAAIFALSIFDAPPAMRAAGPFPDVLTAVFARPDFLIIAWVVFLTVLAVLIATPVKSSRERVARAPLIVLAAFSTVAGISYAQRQHLYFLFVIAPLITASLVFLFRRARAVTTATMIVLVIAAHFTDYLVTLTMLRTARGPLDPNLAEVREIPRARGVFFRVTDARIVENVSRYAREKLGPGETFFDFTNRGNLYFLLDRDCPIRQVEVSYEVERLQREVIDRIERNPRVRAALVAASPYDAAIDGVPNSVRAPLVWAYLQEHFQPDFHDGDVVIWRRK
jgi:hypothetical protein